MARLFIGIPLNDEVRRRIRVYCKKLRKKHWQVRWEPEEKWHITLVFMENVLEVQQVQEELKGIKKQNKIRLKLAGLGQWPKSSRLLVKERISGRLAKPVKVLPEKNIILPKVIWLGVKGDIRTLSRLKNKLSVGLRAKGVETDNKPFRPHVTIGRVMAEASYAHKAEVAKEIAKMGKVKLNEWEANCICVYESRLTPEGSEYRIITKVKLQ